MHPGTKGNNALYKDLWYNWIVCAFWSVSSKKKVSFESDAGTVCITKPEFLVTKDEM